MPHARAFVRLDRSPMLEPFFAIHPWQYHPVRLADGSIEPCWLLNAALRTSSVWVFGRPYFLCHRLPGADRLAMFYPWNKLATQGFWTNLFPPVLSCLLFGLVYAPPIFHLSAPFALSPVFSGFQCFASGLGRLCRSQLGEERPATDRCLVVAGPDLEALLPNFNVSFVLLETAPTRFEIFLDFQFRFGRSESIRRPLCAIRLRRFVRPPSGCCVEVVSLALKLQHSLKIALLWFFGVWHLVGSLFDWVVAFQFYSVRPE